MLGGGVIVQRFGDLVRGQRSTEKRIEGVVHRADPERRRRAT